MSNSLREHRFPARRRVLTTLVDRWVESLERDPNASARVDHDGDKPDRNAPPERLQLEWNGQRLSHAGRLLPTSRQSVTLEDCVRSAGHPHAGAALWRAVQLFGAPFDAINTHRWHRGPFSWGTWGFDATTTAEIISSAGQALSGDAQLPASAELPPELTPLRDADEPAIIALTAQPPAMALLADAAQLPAVRQRQLDLIAERSLRPLAHDRFTEADMVALLLLDQRVGLGTARELVAQVTSTGGGSSQSSAGARLASTGGATWVAIATRHLSDGGQPLTPREWQRLSTAHHGRG